MNVGNWFVWGRDEYMSDEIYRVCVSELDGSFKREYYISLGELVPVLHKLDLAVGKTRE
jgi:hypothetical protein